MAFDLAKQLEIAGRSEYRARLPAGCAAPEELERFGGVLLTPDYPAHGSFDALRRQLGLWQCRIAGAIPLDLTPTEIAHIYNGRASNETEYPANRETWHPNRSRVLSGLSVYLILHGPAGIALQEAIGATKGKSKTPAPGTFRAHSRRCDRYFSLMHCPDDLENFLYECELLLGGTEVLERPPGDAASLPVEAIEVLFARGARPSMEMLDEPVFGALCLGLCRLVCDPRGGADRAEGVTLIERLLSEDRRDATLLRQIADRVAQWQAVELQGLSDADFRAQAGRLARAKLGAALRALCVYRDLHPTEVDAVADCFAEAGVPLDRWTLHRLHLYVSFHGNRAVVGAGGTLRAR